MMAIEDFLRDQENSRRFSAAMKNVRFGDGAPLLEFHELLDEELATIRSVLVRKNEAYGNSALEPVRIFSQSDAVEQLKVRIDDKLSRLMRGADAGEDTEFDLLGYLILLRIARRQGLGA